MDNQDIVCAPEASCVHVLLMLFNTTRARARTTLRWRLSSKNVIQLLGVR